MGVLIIAEAGVNHNGGFKYGQAAGAGGEESGRGRC